MTVVNIGFDPGQVAAGDNLFPLDIEGNPWIVFHGTSSTQESSIDLHGLIPQSVPVTKDEVAAVVAIFESLHWAGRSAGGFPVLKPFSLDHDFAKSDFKPIYLAETSLRATTFATRDFAGGESMRALRYAIDDLRAFLSEADLRTKNLQRLKKEFEYLEGTHHYPDYIHEPDLGELEEKLRELDDLRSRCLKALESHSYGVVYALRFSSNDITDFEYHTAMGLKSLTAIALHHIVAKTRTPSDWQPPLFNKAAQERSFRRFSGCGFINAVHHRCLNS